MVGAAIGFASTTAFPAVERLSENGKGRTNNVVVRGMRFAKLGQTKPFFGLRAARPTEVPNSRLTPPLLHDLKKGFQ